MKSIGIIFLSLALLSLVGQVIWHDSNFITCFWGALVISNVHFAAYKLQRFQLELHVSSLDNE